jgi:hypothetical protein
LDFLSFVEKWGRWRLRAVLECKEGNVEGEGWTGIVEISKRQAPPRRPTLSEVVDESDGQWLLNEYMPSDSKYGGGGEGGEGKEKR